MPIPRLGALIAAAAITTSFFGGQVLARDRVAVSAAVVLACFTGLVLVAAGAWTASRRRWALTTALALGAATMGVLAETALASNGESRSAAMAVASFVALGLVVLAVLWPRRDWEFALDPQWFIANYLEPDEGEALGVSEIHRDIALHMGASAPQNRAQLRQLMAIFRAGAVLLVVEVLAWVVALVSG